MGLRERFTHTKEQKANYVGLKDVIRTSFYDLPQRIQIDPGLKKIFKEISKMTKKSGTEKTGIIGKRNGKFFILQAGKNTPTHSEISVGVCDIYDYFLNNFNEEEKRELKAWEIIIIDDEKVDNLFKIKLPKKTIFASEIVGDFHSHPVSFFPSEADLSDLVGREKIFRTMSSIIINPEFVDFLFITKETPTDTADFEHGIIVKNGEEFVKQNQETVSGDAISEKVYETVIEICQKNKIGYYSLVNDNFKNGAYWQNYYNH